MLGFNFGSVLDFSFKVDDKALIKQLESLGPKCKPLRAKTLRPLAVDIKNAGKPLVPKRKGPLRKSVTIKPIRSKKFYTIGFRVFGKNVAKTKENPKGKFYLFAPEYGVTNGRGKQPGIGFMKKGAKIAEGKVPAVKDAIGRAIVALWKKS